MKIDGQVAIVTGAGSAQGIGFACAKALAADPKRRSRHNTYLAVPATFIMISNHFPTATYGNHFAVSILGTLILVGWGAAALLRRG